MFEQNKNYSFSSLIMNMIDFNAANNSFINPFQNEIKEIQLTAVG